jgi:hypothetical protein
MSASLSSPQTKQSKLSFLEIPLVFGSESSLFLATSVSLVALDGFFDWDASVLP